MMDWLRENLWVAWLSIAGVLAWPSLPRSTSRC